MVSKDKYYTRKALRFPMRTEGSDYRQAFPQLRITNYALLKQFRVILSNDAEAFLSNLDGVLDVLVGKRSVDKVVVMACKEDAAAYHFCDPLLMKNKAVIVGDS